MQAKKLYVGNLNYSVSNDELAELFSAYGVVQQVNIIEGKGFGFVEMASSAEAQKAQEALNNTEFRGRTLRIDEARPPQNRDRDSRSRQDDRNDRQRSPRRY